jgi:hypothetical protein
VAARRAYSEKALFLAAGLTALLATTIIVALGAYAASVTNTGARRTLAAAPAEQVVTRIAAPVTAGSYAKADQTIRTGLAGVYPGVSMTTEVSARGDSYTLPGQQRARHPELTRFAMYTRIGEHATLRAGAWPRPSGASGVVEAVLPEPAATAMKMHVGGTYTLHSRIDGRAARVRISGLFRVDRANDPFWNGDPLVLKGVQRLSYTTFGPLVVAPEAFIGGFMSTGVTVQWRVLPDVRAIAPDTFGAVADRATGLRDRLAKADPATGYIVATNLPALLGQVQQAALVSRSTMAIPILQLLVLSAYALLLVARLLADHRRMEAALLRARGATARQLSLLTAGEGILLTAPAVVAAPLLAPALLWLAGNAAIIKNTGLRLDFSPSPAMWVAAIAAAIGCGMALTLPAVQGISRSHVAIRAARGRGGRRGVLQRAGADVALAFIAALGVWQLVHYGGPVTAQSTEPSRQVLGVDPVIVAGPALALLAGATLVLRVVPFAARAAERLLSRGDGLAPALGTWQVSRRPLRYAGPALLLVMAIAVGVLSVTAGVTWRQSQLDQADFQAGADVRITPPRDVTALAPLGQGAAYGTLPSVTAASPVLQETSSAGNQNVTLLAVDAAKADALFATHPGGQSLSGPLTSGPSTGPPPGAVVPGRPDRLVADVRVVPRDRLSRPGLVARNQLSVTVVDARGVTATVDLGGVPGDGAFHTQSADLTGLAGPGGRLSYPIALRGIRYEYPPELSVGPLTLSLRIQGVAQPPAGTGWTGAFRSTDGRTHTATIRRDTAATLTAELPKVSPPPLLFRYDTGVGARLTAALGRTGAGGAGRAGTAPTIPGIITAELAKRAHVGVGGRITLTEPSGAQSVTVAAIVPALPATPPGAPAVLLDWRAYADRTALATGSDVAPTEWWLATRGDTGPAVRALARHPDWTSEVVDRMALRRELRDAPLGAALQGALVLGFIAALTLAVVGFAVNATVSARERRTEFAVLRALGMSTRQISGTFGVEQLFLVVLGLAGGLALGLVIGHIVIPHTVLTVRATAPYPPVRLIVPWVPVLGLVAGVPALLAVVFAVLVRFLGRGGPGAAIRIGEDR